MQASPVDDALYDEVMGGVVQNNVASAEPCALHPQCFSFWGESLVVNKAAEVSSGPLTYCVELWF